MTKKKNKVICDGLTIAVADRKATLENAREKVNDLISNLSLPQHIASRPLIFDFGGYTIRKLTEYSIFLETPGGAGMEMRNDRLVYWLNHIFVEEM